MNDKERELRAKEFIEFSEGNVGDLDVPSSLLQSLKARLFPNPFKVFGKVVILHGIIGFLSLAICHQFDINPFNTSYSLADLFATAGGHHFCMFACGVFFVAATYVFANVFLSLEELEAVRKYEWLQIGILSLASIAGFALFGAELVTAFVLLWIVGAFIGGLVSIEGSYRFRQQLV